MSELEDQLGAILGNPKMMESIMALAQSMGQPEQPQDGKGPEEKAPPKPPGPQGPPGPPPPGGGDMDMAMINALTGFARNSCIDKEQKALLNALCPYISKDRLQKLEKAMRAAKIAQQASCLLGENGMKLL